MLRFLVLVRQSMPVPADCIRVQWKAFRYRAHRGKNTEVVPEDFRSFSALAESLCPVLFLYLRQHFVELSLLFRSLSQFFAALFFSH